jgi:uncharacterized protein DUF2760
VDAPSPLPFGTRLWLAWSCFFRVLFDGVFAARVHALDAGVPGPSADAEAAARAPVPTASPAPGAARVATATSNDAALQLLALLQREGRLIDFLQQDVSSFSDADIGAAARVVHDGCKKALGAHVEIRAVRSEREGSPVTLDVVEPSAVKLVGNVSGSPPFRGTLRHRGWRAESVRLPERVAGHDPFVLAPAEVEL